MKHNYAFLGDNELTWNSWCYRTVMLSNCLDERAHCVDSDKISPSGPISKYLTFAKFSRWEFAQTNFLTLNFYDHFNAT